jgi:hypothetical protein
MKLCPGEHQPKLADLEIALDHLDEIKANLRAGPACRAWKCGKPRSSKYIAITIP